MILTDEEVKLPTGTMVVPDYFSMQGGIIHNARIVPFSKEVRANFADVHFVNCDLSEMEQQPKAFFYNCYFEKCFFLGVG